VDDQGAAARELAPHAGREEDEVLPAQVDLARLAIFVRIEPVEVCVALGQKRLDFRGVRPCGGDDSLVRYGHAGGDLLTLGA
jgi:hypothetical protein